MQECNLRQFLAYREYVLEQMRGVINVEIAKSHAELAEIHRIKTALGIPHRDVHGNELHWKG